MRNLVVLAGAVLLAASLATPAEAGKRPRQCERPDRNSRHFRAHHPHRPPAPVPVYLGRHRHARAPWSVAPLTINRSSWETHYLGRSWHGAHRHFHTVYAFPVGPGLRARWAPHAYCEGRLFRGHVAYRGPQLDIDFRF